MNEKEGFEESFKLGNTEKYYYKHKENDPVCECEFPTIYSYYPFECFNCKRIMRHASSELKVEELIGEIVSKGLEAMSNKEDLRTSTD